MIKRLVVGDIGKNSVQILVFYTVDIDKFFITLLLQSMPQYLNDRTLSVQRLPRRAR